MGNAFPAMWNNDDPSVRDARGRAIPDSARR